MDPSQAIYERLKVDTTLQPLVGDRIYPLRAKQEETTPYVTWRVVASNDHETFEGASDLWERRYEFVSHSRDYDQARAIIEAVKASLQGFQGLMGTCDIDSIQFAGGDGGSDGYDDDEGLYETTIDFTVFYHPS